MSEFKTVFEFSINDRCVVEGSKKQNEDGTIAVFFGYKVDGKFVRSTSTDRETEEQVKIFFYDKLRNELKDSWLIMRTIISEETEVFYKQMREIEQRIPAAIVAKYEGILGPLDKINQMVLNKTIIELKTIYESWRK